MFCNFRKILPILCVNLSFFLFSFCGKEPDQSNESVLALVALSQTATTTTATNAPVIELPAPALNTAQLRIGDKISVIPNANNVCQNGATGLGFFNGADVPTLFIHDVNFTQNSGIVLTRTGAYHMDIDVTGGYYSPTSTCPATIRENSATVYEIESYNCPVRAQIGSMADTIVSFRARCTKN